MTELHTETPGTPETTFGTPAGGVDPARDAALAAEGETPATEESAHTEPETTPGTETTPETVPEPETAPETPGEAPTAPDVVPETPTEPTAPAAEGETQPTEPTGGEG